MSLRKNADSLLKDLYLHLSSKCSISRLRQLGCFDFRNHDRPDTTDAVALTYAAFIHLSMNEEGNWNSSTDVLIAVIAYLGEATGYKANEAHIENLAALLREQLARLPAIQNWFDQTFR